MKRDSRILLSAFAMLLMLSPAPSLAATIFESGALGPTGLTFDDFGGGTAPSGSGVTPDVFSGVRFQLSQPVMTTRIGGHFVVRPFNDDSFFGTIVQLDDVSDFPDSGDLSTPDVLGKTLLAFPDTSEEVFGAIAITLNPGWYALVFGSGLFEASGSGAAILNNPDIGSPSYIGHQTASGWFDLSNLPGPFENYRLVVEGTVVPEPDSVAVALLAVTLLLLMSRVIKKSCA